MEQLNTIVKQIELKGGKCFCVGGSVRDMLLNIDVFDYDIEVYNIKFEMLISVLSKFGELIINKEFYTIKIKGQPNYEFSLPRVEISCGNKYSDFVVSLINDNNYKLASKRRDFTVNSMLMAVGTNNVIDNYNGQQALDNRVLRHVSDKFSEDSLRVLRGLRLSAKLGFTFDFTTYELCLDMVKNISVISNERFSKEITRMISEKHFDIAIIYFIELFKDYFSITNANISKLKELVHCNDIKVRTMLMFKYIETTNVEFMKKRCINNKKIKEDIDFVLSNSFSTIEDFYLIVQKYSEEETKLLYQHINNQDVSIMYNLYLDLRKQYCAEYFINLGYSGKEISEQIKSNIIRELNMGDCHGFSKNVTGI